MLSSLLVEVQAAVLYRQFPDLVSHFNDGGIAPEVGVGGRDVAKAFLVSAVVVMVHEDFYFAIERRSK
jgi:hypothetical protein